MYPSQNLGRSLRSRTGKRLAIERIAAIFPACCAAAGCPVYPRLVTRDFRACLPTACSSDRQRCSAGSGEWLGATGGMGFHVRHGDDGVCVLVGGAPRGPRPQPPGCRSRTPQIRRSALPAGCHEAGHRPARTRPPRHQPPRPRLGAAAGWGGGISCVPYARSVTGMAISGNGGDWWYNAAGSYDRGHQPEPGSVMAFRQPAACPAAMSPWSAACSTTARC